LLQLQVLAHRADYGSNSAQCPLEDENIFGASTLKKKLASGVDNNGFKRGKLRYDKAGFFKGGTQYSKRR
jgi:hypothetical protein